MAVPEIDVSALAGGLPQAKGEVARALRAACTGSGFLTIVGHGVPEAAMDDLLARARALFALSLEEKQALIGTGRHGDRGYAQMPNPPQPDGIVRPVKEEYYAGRERPPGHPDANRWPARPGFRDAVLSYVEQMHALAERLMAGLALSLDLPEDHFAAFCTDPIAALRLVRYPPGALGAAPHTDYGSLTLLLVDDKGGLEVRDHATDRWVEITPRRGALVVNIGDLVERWTNGRYHSTEHRVTLRGDQDRYSAPFFLSGAADHPIVCLPSCLAPGDAPRFPPTTVSGHLAQRLAGG